jgi:hypothetical protein
MKRILPWVKALQYFIISLVFCTCSTLPDSIPFSGEDFSFVVIGDVQQGYGIFGELASGIGDLEPAPGAVIFTGDYMSEAANELEWIHFWNCARPITVRMPVYLARGNHEGNTPEDEYAFRTYGRIPFRQFYYAVQQAGLLYLILDTHIKGEERSIGGAQLAWLKEELDRSDRDTSVSHLFLFMHEPLFPRANHVGLGLTNAEELHALFRSHPKIRAIFAGHEHLFSRNERDGLDYIISGGGGAYLIHGYGGDYFHFVKVSFFREENRVNLKTIGLFHEVVEDFNL